MEGFKRVEGREGTIMLRHLATGMCYSLMRIPGGWQVVAVPQRGGRRLVGRVTWYAEALTAMQDDAMAIQEGIRV